MIGIETPIFEVWQGDTDITEMIERFSFEESTEKDNFLSLTIASRFSEDFNSDNAIAQGAELVFRFGVAGGVMSQYHKCTVKSVPYKYGDRVTVTVKALDAGNKLKQNKGGRAYANTTTGDIVRQIARKYGLKANVEGGKTVVDFMPEAGRSNMDILKCLAALEPLGDYAPYIAGDTIHYVRRGTPKDSRRVFTYRDGTGDMIEFDSDFKEASKDASATVAVEAAGFDPLAKKPTTATVTPETEAPNTKLGGQQAVSSLYFDENGNDLGKRVFVPPSATAEGSGAKKPSAVGNGTAKGAMLLTATMKTPIDASIRPNDVITIAGVYTRDIGNWLVTSAKHDISQSGGFTTLGLTKNGTANRGGVRSKKVNGTVGGATSEQKVQVFNKDADRIK